MSYKDGTKKMIIEGRSDSIQQSFIVWTSLRICLSCISLSIFCLSAIGIIPLLIEIVVHEDMTIKDISLECICVLLCDRDCVSMFIDNRYPSLYHHLLTHSKWIFISSFHTHSQCLPNLISIASTYIDDGISTSSPYYNGRSPKLCAQVFYNLTCYEEGKTALHAPRENSFVPQKEIN